MTPNEKEGAPPIETPERVEVVDLEAAIQAGRFLTVAELSAFADSCIVQDGN